jgi:two-component system, cell cycle response regulator DivK
MDPKRTFGVEVSAGQYDHSCEAFVPYVTRDYEITEAENGEEALAAIAKQRPNLILMDIQLPVMDGYEAARRIKADPALRSIPIIAVTSYALSGEEKKARAAGCDEYVPKPFSPRQLLAKIREYLQ